MKKTLLIVALFVASIGVHAATYTSMNDGAWNDPATWNPVGVPNVTNTSAWPGDNVIINHAVSFSGNLKTAKQSSITINSGGSLSVSGALDVANSNPANFTLTSNGSLSAGNLIISTCCATVVLNGTVNTQNLTYSGSKPISIGGTVSVSGDFIGGTTSSINFTGGSFTVAGSTTAGGSVQFLVDGGAQLSLGNLTLSGSADIKGINAGGSIGWTTLSLANSSTSIQCVGNVCDYHGGGGTPPNPLDLVSGGQALPVELLSFSVNALKTGQVDIQWSTAVESENDFFLLEYSTDGINFETIATIEGAGTTQQQRNYQWTHDKPQVGINYYRLGQFDLDGSFKALGLEQVRLSNNTFTIAGVSPNPGFSGSSVMLNLPTDTHSIQVHLVCSSGQQWPLHFYQSGAAVQLQLPADLPSGMYYLSVSSGVQFETIPLAIIGQ